MVCLPDFKEFIKLARKGNVIPVFTEILADTETPVSAFLKIKEEGYSFLLESVEGGEKIGRYSFMGTNPSLIFRYKNKKVTIKQGKETFTFVTEDSPLDEINNMLKNLKVVEVKGLPRFCGGFVGYVGYDIVTTFENIKINKKDDLGLDDMIFIMADTVLIFDHVGHKIKIVVNVFLEDNPKESYQKAVRKIKTIIKKLSENTIEDYENTNYSEVSLKPQKSFFSHNIRSNFSKKQFMKIVDKAKKYIYAGDIIQVVLSQRFKTALKKAKPFDLYRALRTVNPSPYMFYIDFKELQLVGSSPELLVRCENHILETRPIAGTRPRGRTEAEDEKFKKELLADPKEIAEHIMLVDLGRNDLGRVSEAGSVKTEEFMAIEKYSHVMHIVSSVKGVLEKTKYPTDVIKATFPAGTVAGAPKVRAMQIIEELENIKRGIYAGCIGYIDFSGNIDTCIAIRTILIKGENAYVQAGAGIVADSKPAKEYEETRNKARALMKAIEIAEALRSKK